MMDRNILCLSCLNGQLKAVAMQRGSVTRAWERPTPVEDFAEFAEVVKEAAEKTGYTGQQVALVVAHPRLNAQIVEVPPVKGWTLERYLHRRAQHLKTFDGEAVWSQQPAVPTKNAAAVLLHLVPAVLLSQLVRGCEKAGFQLVRVLPATAVLGTQMTEFQMEKDELALLAAETGSSTTIVVARADGHICLSRSLNVNPHQQPDRVAVDVTRTIGFAEQQSGSSVSSVWLFGEGMAAHLAEMQALLKLPVRPSPVAFSPSYWAEQAARPTVRGNGDLVSPEAREAPRRRRFLQVTVGILMVLFVAAVINAAYFEWTRRADLKLIAKLGTEIDRTARLKTEWQQRHADLLQKAELVRVVIEEEPPPVAGSFLGYLSAMGSEELLLTELKMTRTNGAWAVRLAGTAQPTKNPAPDAVFRTAFMETTNSLVQGPFQLIVTKSVLTDGAGNPAVTSQETEGRPTASPDQENQKPGTFVVEGVVR